MGEESMLDRVVEYMGYAPGSKDGRRLARAAIMAMREPTKAMLNAITPDVCDDIANYERYEATSIYSAMITAALQDPTSKEQEREG